MGGLAMRWSAARAIGWLSICLFPRLPAKDARFNYFMHAPEYSISANFWWLHILLFGIIAASFLLVLFWPGRMRSRAKTYEPKMMADDKKDGRIYQNSFAGGNRVGERPGKRSRKWAGWVKNVFARMYGNYYSTLLWNLSIATERLQLGHAPIGTKKISSITFRNYPESMAITSLKDGRFIDVNEGFEDLTGYSILDLQGKTTVQTRLWPQADDRDWLVEQLSSHARVADMEEKIRVKSGEIRHVLVSGRPLSLRGEDCILMIFRDITDKKLNEERSRLQMQRLATLRVVDLAIAESMDLDHVLNILLEKMIGELKVDSCLLLLLNSNQHLVYRAVKGIENEAIKQTDVKLGEKYAGWVALSCKPVYILQNDENPNPFLRRSDIARAGYIAYYCTPLIAKGRVLGVVEIFNRKPLPSDPEWISFFEALADQTAIAIDNASLMEMAEKTNRELVAAYDATIQGWARALELRDAVTEGHSQRVLNMTLTIAREMGFQESDLVHIQRGALLHDIGKMAVPDAILFKAGPLMPEEWEIMRKHPQYAYELLSSVPFLKPALDIPYCHHERWNGSGYPRGLKGEEIPLAARIFAVVDVWDALLSNRPYRSAWDEEQTKKYIQQNAGVLFDPVVIDVFFKQVTGPDLSNKSLPK